MNQQEFFNRYSFNIRTDKIGGGSFGTVYKAYDTFLDREVAVKVSEVKMIGDKEFSLREEFKAIENVSAHPNIANYEEVFTFDTPHGIFDYAVMQYYPLGNLDSFLKNTPLDVSQKEKLILDILEGVNHLHQHKVVHRDLKPSNILVVDRKGQIIPKITDFGLSKQASSDGKESRFTNSFAGGTLQYSSPEQLKGLPLKLNTDLWSFGTIGYEIFMGEPLFVATENNTASAEWQNEVTQKILKEDVNEKLSELPKNWTAAIASCLHRDLNDRAKSREEIVSHLKDDVSVMVTTNPARGIDETMIKPPSKKERQKEVLKKKRYEAPTLAKKKEDSRTLTLLAIVVLVLVISFGYWIYSDGEKSEALYNKTTKFQKDELFGYKKEGKVIIPALYTVAGDFKDGEALVEVKDSTYYINEKGLWLRTKEKIENSEITNSISDKNAIDRKKNNTHNTNGENNIDSQKDKNKKTLEKETTNDPPPPPPGLPETIEIVDDETNSKEEEIDVPFAVIEEVPIFPGCENATDKRSCFNQKIQEHVRENFQYPTIAQELGIQGRVSIMFTIQKDGSIGNIRMRGPDVNLEKEAERIIKLLPRMTAGKQRGRAVRVPFSIPITFKLQ